MSDVTDADRKKATALLRAWREETPEGGLAAVAPRAQIALVEAVAQALADEREKARAPFLALADTWDRLRPKDRSVHRYHAALNDAAELVRRAAEEQS